MRTLPTRTVAAILNLGPPLLLEVPDPGVPAREYGSFVAGMHDGHGGYTHPGGQRGVQLDLTPLGAYTLLGVPMARVTNTAVELPDLDLMRTGGTGLADIALACGYYDQAHLNREVRALSGCSPTELLAGQLEPELVTTVPEAP